MKFTMLTNVKMPTIIVGIFTLMNMINISESLKARKVFTFQYFSLYYQLKFHAQLGLSINHVFITWGPDHFIC